MSSYDVYFEFKDGSVGAIRSQSQDFIRNVILKNDSDGVLRRHNIANFWITDGKIVVWNTHSRNWRFGHADHEA